VCLLPLITFLLLICRPTRLLPDLDLAFLVSNMTASRAGTPRAIAETTLLAKNIQRLLTLNSKLGEIDDAAIYVKANIIQWVGTTADLPDEYKTADVVLDLSSRVVIPGMVNTHHHMYVGYVTLHACGYT
jgi:adenine deaminase